MTSPEPEPASAPDAPVTSQARPAAGDVPTFEPVPMDPTEADTIRRQDIDAEGWYYGLPWHGRP